MQEYPIHPSQFHDKYALEVAKYSHLAGTVVCVDEYKAQQRRKRPPPTLEYHTEGGEAITYAPPYKVTFTHPQHGTATFNVNVGFTSANKAQWLVRQPYVNLQIKGGRLQLGCRAW